MQHVRYTLVAVAFVRSVGGLLRVLLLAVDADGEPLHGGEPVLMLEVRPGAGPETVVVEPADALPATVHSIVAEQVAAPFVVMVEAAFDDTGEFQGNRLAGSTVEVHAPAGSFGERPDRL